MTAYELLSSTLVQDAADQMDERTPLICLRAERDRLCCELLDGLYLQSRDMALIEADLELYCSLGKDHINADDRLYADIERVWSSTQPRLFQVFKQLTKVVGLVYIVERREAAELLSILNPATLSVRSSE